MTKITLSLDKTGEKIWVNGFERKIFLTENPDPIGAAIAHICCYSGERYTKQLIENELFEHKFTRQTFQVLKNFLLTKKSK